ncbi:hypothetical protein B5M09_003487 [Aphanomyces astaci]|nr:hypothetical protein B5M09_003487 [Aphanomyces astaci]
MMPPWPVFRTCSPRLSNRIHESSSHCKDKDKLDSTVILCHSNDGVCCDDLFAAVLAGNADSITLIVDQQGCDVNRMFSCRPGDLCMSLNCVRRSKVRTNTTVQRKSSLPTDAQPTCGYSLLQLAIQAGLLASVDALLDAGANPALHPETSPSCLCLALAHTDDMFHRVLRHLKSVDDDAVEAISAAGSLPRFSALSNRLSSAQRIKALAVAASHEHLHLVQHLMDTGDDVVIQRGLHAMVQQGCLALVRHVVKCYGPSVVLYCEPNKLGDSLLHTACRAKQPEIIKYLIRCGVDVNAPNAIGVSALYMCSALGSDVAVHMLIKAGAQPRGAMGPHGDTALHVAVQENHLQTVRLLIHSGAPLDAQNEQGNTPLHVACMQGHAAIAAYVVRKGADLHRTNSNGETPLVKACQMSHRRVVELLASHGDKVKGLAYYDVMKGGRHKITKPTKPDRDWC